MKLFQNDLAALEKRGRLRSLKTPSGVDLTSNDYLGLAHHPALRASAIEALQNGIDIGAGGSRLLRGNTPAHVALEDFASAYFAAPKTLFFSSGFLANTAILGALPTRHDTILFDEFVHASARIAIQNSPARHIRMPHNDVAGLEVLLQNNAAKGRIWIVIESLYSMEGDLAPLEEIYALAERYNAILIIDEAHATGVLGPTGKGLSETLTLEKAYERVITLHTCGKALGVAGGLVCANADIIDILINTARPFIYSTAPMPLQAFLVQQSLALIQSGEGQARRTKLQGLSMLAQKLFGGAGTHIVPIMIGADARAVEIAEKLQYAGYDIRAIRPPTVPEGTARLRLSLSAALEEKTLYDFAEALMPLMKESTE